jgi:hypothetical protein
MGELIVAADLLARGYEVFKNVAVHGKVDLIAYKKGKCWTVQVRCKHFNFEGNRGVISPVNIVAIVLPSHRVIYTPSVDPRQGCGADWHGHETSKRSAADWEAYLKESTPGTAEDQGGEA